MLTFDLTTKINLINITTLKLDNFQYPILVRTQTHTHTRVTSNKNIKELLEREWKKKGKSYMKFPLNYPCSKFWLNVVV